MTDSSGISVVIPTYNGSRFIGEAIESVWRQTCLPREIIVVDDCSTDDTVAVVERLAADSPVPIRVIKLDKNSGGPAHPINVGVEAVVGEFVIVLDQDDVFENDSLAAHGRTLEAFPGIVASCLLPGNYEKDGRPMLRSIVREELTKALGGPSQAAAVEGNQMQQLLIRHKNFLVGFPAFAFRKSIWEQVGGLSARWKIAADFDFLFRLAGAGRVAITDQIGYLRRVHDSNVCHNRSAMYLEVAQVTADVMTRFPDLKADGQCVRDAQQCLSEIAFRLRQSGNYRSSLQCHIRALQTGGLDGRSILEVLKLLPHWMLTKMGAITISRTARPVAR